MTDNTKIKSELNKICLYNGLICSKYTLLVLLAILYFPMHTTAYIFISAIVVPALFSLMVGQSASNNDNIEEFILAPTAKKYHFTYLRYRSEKFSSVCLLMLMLAWQVSANVNFVMPWQIIPTVTIIIYILTRFFSSLFFRFKINHDFMHLNI